MVSIKNIEIDRTYLSCSTFRDTVCFKIINSIYSRLEHQKGESVDFYKLSFIKTDKCLVGFDLYVATLTNPNGKEIFTYVSKNQYNEFFKQWFSYIREKNIDFILNS